MSDHAGANYNSLITVFGESAGERSIGCTFHFLQDARRRRVLLPESQQDRFMETCKTLDRVSTSWNFMEVQKSLEEFVKSTPALDPWYKWWMARRSHTFSAFINPDATHVNLAEAGNKSFNVRGQSRKLVDASNRDIAAMLIQDRQLKHYQAQSMPVTLGRGPSASQLASKERLQQMKRAQEYGRTLLNMDANDLELDPMENFHPGRRTNFKPPPKKKTYTVEGTSTLPCYSAITRAEVLKNIECAEELYGLTLDMGRPNWKNSPNPNPPTIKMLKDVSRRVSKCQGCKSPIDQKQTPPMDLIITLRGDRTYYKDGEKKQSDGNLYLHCERKCLFTRYPNMEMKEITASDYTFSTLITGHFHILESHGMLRCLLSSKKFQ